MSKRRAFPTLLAVVCLVLVLVTTSTVAAQPVEFCGEPLVVDLVTSSGLVMGHLTVANCEESLCLTWDLALEMQEYGWSFDVVSYSIATEVGDLGSLIITEYADSDNHHVVCVPLDGSWKSAGTVLVAASASLMNDQETNHVVNGSFEEPAVAAGQWNVFSEVEGWEVIWQSSQTSYGGQTRPSNALLEIHHGVNGWNAPTGSQYTELDSDWDGPSGSLSGEPANVRVSQTVETIPNHPYVLCCAHSPRPGVANNALTVYWEGTAQETISRSGASLSNPNWQTFLCEVVASDDQSTLAFAETGSANSLGMFLDNVRLLAYGGPWLAWVDGETFYYGDEQTGRYVSYDIQKCGSDGPDGRLTVTVIKTDGGDVSGLPVTFGGDLAATVHTNASGEATVTGLWAGDYTANASDSGYVSNGPKSVTLPDDDSEESMTITLTVVPPAPPEPGPGAIEGKAEDGTTAAALPGVLVRLIDSTDAIIGMDMTDPAGEFAFEGLPPGSYTVCGSLDGYGADTEVAVVVNDATTEVALQLAAVIVVPPIPPAGEPATPPDLPKTGASLAGLLIVGGLAIGAGVFAKRRGF